MLCCTDYLIIQCGVRGNGAVEREHGNSTLQEKVNERI